MQPSLHRLAGGVSETSVEAYADDRRAAKRVVGTPAVVLIEAEAPVVFTMLRRVVTRPTDDILSASNFIVVSVLFCLLSTLRAQLVSVFWTKTPDLFGLKRASDLIGREALGFLVDVVTALLALPQL